MLGGSCEECENQEAWIQILNPLLISSVVLDKSHIFLSVAVVCLFVLPTTLLCSIFQVTTFLKLSDQFPSRPGQCNILVEGWMGERGGSWRLDTGNPTEPSPSLWPSAASSSRALASDWLVLAPAKRPGNGSNFPFVTTLRYHFSSSIICVKFSLFEILKWVLFSWLIYSAVRWHP